MQNIIFGGHGFVGKNLNLDGERPYQKDCDLLNYDETLNYLQQFKGEKLNIINLAAKVAGVLYNKNHNVEMLYNNSLMAMNLAKAISKLKLDCYYLYISSVCAYNNISTEEAYLFDGEPNNNNYGYGSAKKFGVSILKSLKLDNPNTKTAALIPSNMYGKYDQLEMEYAHVIPTLIQKMKQNPLKLEIYGHASNLRQFLYVNDLNNIIKDFIEWQEEGIYNIVPDDSITVYKLVYKIKELMNYSGELLFNFNMPIDSREIHNNHLKDLYYKKNKELKFTSLDEGLKETINWIC